ncbi:MAG: B12-binding domain-containing radical SAM protein [Candidatus Omnitrophica bacterium]|nr:B12-binding domain-containing radical SAM protein [Candidatus Omnitrophota bacterium]MBU1933094.1 B12-binding domain-containing radical SAM protein [Candidatus Omnitrophota bacterium]
MNIVLINVPYLEVYGKLNVGKNSSFPLGLGYIAAVLRQAGYNVNLLDPEPQGMDLINIRAYLLQKRPDMVGLSCATANFKNALAIGAIVKEAIGVTVVLGGVHASALPREILSNFSQFDFLVIGEGEETIVGLAAFLESGYGSLDDIRGIAYRKDKMIKLTAPRPFMSIEKLAELPFPARDLVDISLYRPQAHLDRGKPAASMITSRGCPARCTFCASYLTTGYAFRWRSPESVVREIEDLVYNYRIEHIIFVDDTFTFLEDRAKKICQLILEKGLEIDWYCFARADKVSEELLLAMKQAGCFSLLFGVESGDEDILRNIKKGITPQQSKQALDTANRMGFKTLAGFMFGNPGETPETAKKTLDFAVELNPTIASFNILVPYPGTEVFKTHYRERFKDPATWDSFLPRAVEPVAETEALTNKDLTRWASWAFIRFYALRPWHVLGMLRKIKTWGEIKSYLRGAWGLTQRIWEWRK